MTDRHKPEIDGPLDITAHELFLCLLPGYEGTDLPAFLGLPLEGMPFVRVEFAVSRQCSAVIDAISDEASASEVVDEDVAGDRIPIARKGCSNAEIVILEIPCAEALVERADLDDQVFPEQHAETDQAPSLDAAAAVFLPEGACVVVEPVDRVVIDGLHSLDAADVVGHRPDDACVRHAMQAFQNPREPPLRRDGVVVEQEDELACSGPDPLVTALREAEVPAVLDELNVAILLDELSQPLDGSVLRPVVDEDDLMRLRRVPADALDAALRVLQLVKGKDNDGRKIASGGNRHGMRMNPRIAARGDSEQSIVYPGIIFDIFPHRL